MQSHFISATAEFHRKARLEPMRFKRNGPLDFEASKQLFNFAAQIFAAVLVLGLVELLRILIGTVTRVCGEKVF